MVKQRLKTIFQATLTIYRSLDFPSQLSLRHEIMLQLLINIDLKPQAKFHKNPTKTLQEQAI